MADTCTCTPNFEIHARLEGNTGPMPKGVSKAESKVKVGSIHVSYIALGIFMIERGYLTYCKAYMMASDLICRTCHFID